MALPGPSRCRRIVAVGHPAHGASKRPGIPVAVAFQDPAAGQEFVLSNVGPRGHRGHRLVPGRLAVAQPEAVTHWIGDRAHGGLLKASLDADGRTLANVEPEVVRPACPSADIEHLHLYG
ncbi:hypothetical protein [Streptomyces sp. NPDC050759]|uniref:hypothetical protein n=1 Tax=Streptomyces sp. NPDC050759 TaxID=3365635 RepID=UPI00379115BA